MRELELRVVVLIIGIVILLLVIAMFLVFRTYTEAPKEKEDLSTIDEFQFPPFDNIDQFKAIFYDRHPEFINKCRADNLTAREIELAALKEIGVSNPRIADLMGINQSTVYTLTKRVKKKQAKT